jgi:hypothetical protein
MDLENEGDADKVIRRDKLLELNPPKLVDKIHTHNYMNALALQYALERMPSAPVNVWLKHRKGAPDEALAYYEKTMPTGEKHRTFKAFESRGEVPSDYTAVTIGDVKKKARKDYLDTYEALKASAEDLLAHHQIGTNFLQTLDDFHSEVSRIIKERRKTDRYDDMANALIPYSNKKIRPWGSSGTQSVPADMARFSMAARKHYGKDAITELHDLPEIEKDVKAIIGEGKNYKKMYVVESDHKDGNDSTSMAKFYLAGAERKGATVEFKTVHEQENFLLQKARVRGLQWGNSVTDEEREHHLKMSAEAMKDLVDVLGLPDEMVSFNGRLALAIGARGKGRAMAHYESALMVINLTRAKGAG